MWEVCVLGGVLGGVGGDVRVLCQNYHNLKHKTPYTGRGFQKDRDSCSTFAQHKLSG